MLVINDKLVVSDNEIVGLIGKNGSGKTTLIKSSLCLDSKAKVVLDGEDFCKNRDYSKLSAVFQDPSTQILALTCEEELKLQSMFHPVDDKIAKEIMGEYFNKDFYTLSDGYKKRFVISTILASRPKYILFDEPFANLDKYAVKLVKSIIPKGSLIAEHRIKEIRDMIDRVYLIKNGDIREIEKEKMYDEDFLRKEGLRGFSLPKIEMELGEELLNHEGIRVRESEVVCLVGRNGVGKTTRLKKLVGKIYLVLQNPDLQFFEETVEDEVKDENALSLFNLKDKKDRSPFTLSYGEKMRVLIASAFASKYKVIALDEPSVGMDGEALLSFYEAIKILKEERRGIIIATHDEDLISICNTIINMDQGPT
ncbi:ATP-binding cassette domain-containing protein [Sulfurisphaera ohwakuensis]|uniref:ATP-binding cassette domain-containing protein n=1 Tax=Sulfurisphaera ohwakuensis TaxID=69656 RepID=UPI0036F22CB9